MNLLPAAGCLHMMPACDITLAEAYLLIKGSGKVYKNPS